MALIVHDDGKNVNFYRNKEKTTKRKEKRKEVAKTRALGYNIRIHRRAFGRRKRTDRLIRSREPPVGARRHGGGSIRSFHAAGDELAGRRPLSVKRGHENGNLGGNAEFLSSHSRGKVNSFFVL